MSRRKQSNPKPSKREIEELKHTELGDHFPTNQIYLREFGNETLVLARQHLSAGTVLGTFRGTLLEETSLDIDTKPLLQLSRCDGGTPVHVMLDNEGRWLKLMRNATVPTDANICLRISGGEILCTVTKDVNKEVELKVTCRIVEQLKNQICEEIESVIDDTSEAGSEGMLNFDSDKTSSLSEEMPSNKQERELRTSPVRRGDSTSDSEVRNDNQEPLNCGSTKDNKIKPYILEESNSGRRKVPVPPDRKQSVDENSIYKCPFCSFLIEDRKIFEKHLQSHPSSSLKRVTSHMTNAQSFCDACNIQFMSVDTYQVHKRHYCKSRREKEDPSSPPASETSPLTIPGAFKPSADTIILRNGTLDGAMAAPSLIQPRAIYAAISTNPLILLPCSLVSGESLVTQNGMITSAGPGIVLQTGASYPAIVGKHPSAPKNEDALPSRKTSHPLMNFSRCSPELVPEESTSLRKRKMSEGDVLNSKKPLRLLHSEERVSTPPSNHQDTPLDLSLKKRKTADISYKRSFERRNNDNMECSPIVGVESCSPPASTGFPPSGIIKSPSSYSNDRILCYTSHEAVSLLKQSRVEGISPSPPVPHGEEKSHVLPPGMPPPKVLKQGNNVCEECNIVFYKYDNYLTHKIRYCAHRQLQIAAEAASSNCNEPSSDDNNSNHSAMRDTARGYNTEENGKAALRRVDEPFRPVTNKPPHSAFVCDACGVKFSSLDTLNAHQTYYCSKRADSVMSKYAKSRSENSGSPSSLEPPFSGPEEWKCNYCETTCFSYETIRRHLLTHSELRGFRCLLCGYKGNTLRGMRAHACEHMNENTASIDEFLSSTVISENDALPISHHAAELSDEDTEASNDHHHTSRRSEDHSETEQPNCKEGGKNSPNGVPFNEQDSPSRVKVETRDSSPEESHCGSVNPLAFCDVVIKTENDQTSSGDESRDRHTFIKTEPEPDSDCDSSSRESSLSESPPVQPISVIRCVPDKNRKSTEKNSDSKAKPTELKYCKSCDISFYHMSNFVAHKKYYCSHPVPNCIKETTTVQ